MVQNFKQQFPRVAEDAVMYEEISGVELVVTLRDGRVIMYDDVRQTIRKLPRDKNNMTEDEWRREFGNRLRNIMDRNDISVTELSERSGIAQPIISNYRNGKNTPSFYNVDRLARALGCSIDDLRYL